MWKIPYTCKRILKEWNNYCKIVFFAPRNMATLKFDTYDSLARGPLSPFSVTTSKPMRILPFRISSVRNPLVELPLSYNNLHTFCINIVFPMPGKAKFITWQITFHYTFLKTECVVHWRKTRSYLEIDSEMCAIFTVCKKQMVKYYYVNLRKQFLCWEKLFNITAKKSANPHKKQWF
jgi:hypothetical protein